MTGAGQIKRLRKRSCSAKPIIAATSEADKFIRIPDLSGIEVPSNAAYLHITSNETIEGTQYAAFPKPAM